MPIQNASQDRWPDALKAKILLWHRAELPLDANQGSLHHAFTEVLYQHSDSSTADGIAR